MGFWDSLGEGLFGTTSKAEGRQGRTNAMNTANTVAGQAGNLAGYAGGQAQAYNTGAAQSMGTNAADYMQKANLAAQSGAEQAGQAVATGANRQQLQAARTAGMNKAQAAQMGGQAGGNAYGNVYQSQLAAGQNQYQNAAQQFANQGQAMMGQQQGALGLQGNMAGQQAAIANAATGAGQAQSQQTWGTIGNVAGAIASDERVKQNIRPSANIDDIMKKVRPVSYEYKKTAVGLPGVTPGEKQGVLAQDLEKTGLASAVKETADGTKVIDTNELSPMLLNLVIQLAKKVDGGKNA